MAKLKEMGCAGGATIGPIQPAGGPNVERLGVEKEKVEHMLSIHKDLNEKHVAIFALESDRMIRENFQFEARWYDFDSMADIVREVVARHAVRAKLSEIVRKKGDIFILYAPNKNKRHDPQPVATFNTKLDAKQAELDRFPPPDPKERDRLVKSIEKLRRKIGSILRDPKKPSTDLKEFVTIDLVERALISATLSRYLVEGMGRNPDADAGAQEFMNSIGDIAKADPKMKR
jgi:hypothetical protein